MIFPPLNNAANLLAWSRQLITKLDQREAKFVNLGVYASDSAAGTAGLMAGDFYKTSDGSGGYYLKVKS